MRLISAVLLISLASCGRAAPQVSSEVVLTEKSFGAAEARKASEIYDSLCANCHGATGKGDGADGRTKIYQPRAFTDPVWQRESSDELIAQTIVFGGEAVGLSEEMQAFPDLLRNRPVLAALVAQLRKFGQ